MLLERDKKYGVDYKEKKKKRESIPTPKKNPMVDQWEKGNAT
jgi:hypothetical protein